jgi:hypothetical protein
VYGHETRCTVERSRRILQKYRKIVKQSHKSCLVCCKQDVRMSIVQRCSEPFWTSTYPHQLLHIIFNHIYHGNMGSSSLVIDRGFQRSKKHSHFLDLHLYQSAEDTRLLFNLDLVIPNQRMIDFPSSRHDILYFWDLYVIPLVRTMHPHELLCQDDNNAVV